MEFNHILGKFLIDYIALIIHKIFPEPVLPSFLGMTQQTPYLFPHANTQTSRFLGSHASSVGRVLERGQTAGVVSTHSLNDMK